MNRSLFGLEFSFRHGASRLLKMENEKRNLSVGPRRWAWIILFTGSLLLAACASGSEALIDDLDGNEGSSNGFLAAEGSRETQGGDDPDEQLSGAPASIPLVQPESEVETTTTEAPETTTSTEPEETTPTTEAPDEPGVVQPEDLNLPRIVADDLGVITEPGDPLNVRSGPGTEFDVVSELDHQTTGVVSTHISNQSSGEWRFIEVDGEPVGWVAGRFLRNVVDPAFCVAPQEMPAGLVGQSPAAVNIDEGGVLDTVAVFVEELGGGSERHWVRADLDSGGVIAGVTPTLTRPPAEPALDVQFIGNTNALSFGSQVLVRTFQVGRNSDWMVFELVGCEFEVVTLDGEPFTFRSGGIIETGCIYGGSENRFVVYHDDASSRTIDEYVFNGTEVRFASRTISGPDPDTGERELPAGLTTCLR